MILVQRARRAREKAENARNGKNVLKWVLGGVTKAVERRVAEVGGKGRTEGKDGGKEIMRRMIEKVEREFDAANNEESRILFLECKEKLEKLERALRFDRILATLGNSTKESLDTSCISDTSFNESFMHEEDSEIDSFRHDLEDDSSKGNMSDRSKSSLSEVRNLQSIFDSKLASLSTKRTAIEILEERKRNINQSISYAKEEEMFLDSRIASLSPDITEMEKLLETTTARIATKSKVLSTIRRVLDERAPRTAALLPTKKKSCSIDLTSSPRPVITSSQQRGTPEPTSFQKKQKPVSVARGSPDTSLNLSMVSLPCMKPKDMKVSRYFWNPRFLGVGQVGNMFE